MRKKIYILTLFLGLLFTSCDKWIDIAPQEDNIDEKTMFRSEGAFRNGVNGIYTDLRHGELYSGVTLFLELLGQQYGPHDKYIEGWIQFNYTGTAGSILTKSTWGQMFYTIYNCNNLIRLFDENRDVVFTESAREILLGELYGLRAMMHFDLLRMYHEPYAANAQFTRLPYMETINQQAKRLSSEQIISKILADINTAENLMYGKDPIYTGIDIDAANNDTYFGLRVALRKWKLNYYAVKALKARVLMYAGKDAEAAVEAQAIIAATKDGKSGIQNVWNTPSSSDKAFSEEHLFGLATQNLEHIDNYFMALSTSIFSQSPVNPRVTKWLTANPTDQRKMWYNSSKTQLVEKFGLNSKIDNAVYQRIPMLKISEMYLIAAEALATDNFATAKSLFAEFKTKRTGVDISAQIANSDELIEMIDSEYKYEFMGEGQLFFYYKRHNAKVIDSYIEGQTVTMNSKKYTFPVPEGGL